jgi:purine-binding chemotaxis protein CheW
VLHTPRFVKGITNLRGVVPPAVDLRKRFGLPAEEATVRFPPIVTTMNSAVITDIAKVDD